MANETPHMAHHLATDYADHFGRIIDYDEWSATARVIGESVNAALPEEAQL